MTENTVDGSFGGAVWVYATDVDGDGDTDVLGAARSDDEITWWENADGVGATWTEHTVDDAFIEAFSVYATDVDGDGDTDVLGAAYIGDDITWWENTGACTGTGGSCDTWVEHTVDASFDGAISVYATDVDGDGDIDVLGAAENDDDITWWENTDGVGTTWTEHTVDGSFDGAHSLYAADVDGDGDIDVLGAAENDDDITWWENTDGTGTTWTEHTVDGSFDDALSVYATDVDGDGDTDVLGTAFNDDDITWWENTGTCSGTGGSCDTWVEHTVDGSFDGTRSVFATDVDGDGDTDVLGAAYNDDDITWWENETIHRSAVYPEEHTVDGSFDGAVWVYATDVDGDGDTDVLGAARNDNDITWWENTDSGGATWTEHNVDDAFGEAFSVYATDVDGDGDTDVLGAAYSGNDITWWENTGACTGTGGSCDTWVEHTVDASFDGAISVYATDVDGDGDTDVLGAGYEADDITWWENTEPCTGTGGSCDTWVEHTVDASFDGAYSVYAADVDGDGDIDVLGAAENDDDITWWENTDGAGTTWTEHTVDGSFDGAHSLYATDVDGDGDVDVLGAAENDDDIAWWENTDGAGTTWTEHTVDGSFDGALSVYAADIDGDGDTDVLGTAASADDITWWENTDGAGTTWTEHTIDGSFDGTRSVYATDVDGDGDTDVLGVANVADDITWWQNRGGQFALPTTDLTPLNVANGTTAAALAIDATHRGRPGEQDIELATLELLLEDGDGTPLTNVQAGELLTELAIYLDDGSSVFELGNDTKVASVSSFSLTAGALAVAFADGDASVQIAQGTPRRYFVTLSLTADASLQSLRTIGVTHLTEASSTGEDAEHDLPVALEFSANQTSFIAANQRPVAVGDTASVQEDSGTVAGNVLDGSSGGLDTDGDTDPLTAALVSGPTNGTLIGNLATGGAFVYEPNPDFSGVDSFTYVANDGIDNSLPATVTITVSPVNDAPSFAVPAQVAIEQDLGAQTFVAFATAVSAGPASETGQALVFEITNNTEPTLFSVGPTLDSSGTLTFTSAPGEVGVATITVRLTDDGGTDNGGVDTSATQDFNIAILSETVPFDGSTVDGSFDGATSVYATDVDGDGDTDVLGAAADAHDITWWENTNGGSTWTAHTVAGSFFGARSVYATDVDGDGDIDVLGAAEIDDDITWWENTGPCTGTGGSCDTWVEHTVDAYFNGAISVYATDVDGDGDTDVLGAALNHNDITWWENTGPCTGPGGGCSNWDEHTVDSSFRDAFSVYATDVDGDGDTDVLGAAALDDDITWWENTGPCTGPGGRCSNWVEHTVDASFDGATSVYATDVDGDGDTDVLGTAFNGDDITWWENTGSCSGSCAGWIEHTVDASFDGARSAYATDVDGDGDTDVLGTAFNDDSIAWWENTGPCTGPGGRCSNWVEHTVDDSYDAPRSVYATDVDGDGDTDVLGTAFNDDSIAWWDNETIHRSAVFPEEHTVDGSFDGAFSVYATDVDGDGDTDVLGAAQAADDVTWWENTAADGGGTAWTEHAVDSSFGGVRSVYATDVDGDGDTDVLGAAGGVGEIAWWENTGTCIGVGGSCSGWIEHTVDGSFFGAYSVYATDLDGDGDTDVLGAAQTAGVISWWENTDVDGGGTSWTEHTVDTLFDGAHAVYATDVDGDGDTDVLGAANVADDITWWENTDGTGTTWTEHTVDSSFDGAHAVYATDVDGDGDTDVLGAASIDDDITWWENTDGTGTTWTEHTVDGSFDSARSVYATDVDGDGDIDVLGAAHDLVGAAQNVSWWENTDGTGTTWTEHTVDGSFVGARSVYATDVDGDGDVDVLGAALNDDDITWWENRGGQFALPTTDVAPLFVANGATVATLAIDATHRGRTGEQDIELTTLELLLEDGDGTPLTDIQADNLMAGLAIYLDDGSSVFEVGSDTEVASVSSFSLAAGVLTVEFVDGDANVQIAQGTPRRNFVALSFAADANAQTLRTVRVTHLTEASSTGKDANHDLPLVLEFSANRTSSVMAANQGPVAVNDATGLLEDSGTVAGNVLNGSSGGLDTDADTDPLTATLASGPSNGTLVGGLSTNGDFTYAPHPNFSGPDSFTYVANDSFVNSIPATVTITVAPVNDPPSFAVAAQAEVDQDLGEQTFAGFASALSAGPVDEAGQTLAFEITNNTEPTLFSVAPALDSSGTLTFTSAPGEAGVATISVRLTDNGGTDNGGVDSSATQAFDIVILDSIEPQVTTVATVADGLIEDCSELRSKTPSLLVTFSERMADPVGDTDVQDVTNPANYQLIASGADNDLSSSFCGVLLGDDELVPATTAAFNDLTNEATVQFAGGMLADSAYRLLVCDELEDEGGNALGEDFAVTFRQTAANGLTNGNVDCDLNAWDLTSTAPEEIEYSSEDVDDASISGSIYLTNLAGTEFSVGQCLNTTGSLFGVGASLRIDGASDVELNVSTSCSFFDQEDCIGNIIEQASDQELLGETAGLWHPWSLSFAAQGTLSAQCRFELDHLLGGTFEAYLDNLTFDVRLLFGDGFESGDLQAWSSSSR